MRSFLILALAASACGSPPSLAPLTRDGLASVRTVFNATTGPRAIVFFSSGCAACDTGSHALADALATIPGPLALFAVWEPISDDDPPPTARLLGNLAADARVHQLWDPAHLMSDEMRASEVAHPGSPRQARTRTDNADAGIMYDTVVLFAHGRRWDATLPAPDYLEVGLAAIVLDVREKLLAMQTVR